MKNQSRILIVALSIFVSFGILFYADTICAETKKNTTHRLSFGIVPQQSASELARRWVPVLLYLSEITGYDIRFKTAKDIPTFEARVARGEYDLAYMNPYHYTVFQKSQGYRALLAAKDRKIKGIIVTRKDSKLDKISKLKKSVIAYPSPAAFAASVLPRAFLNKRGIVHTPKYVLSHDSVYRAVAKGLYPAGGGIIRTFNNIPQDIRRKLKIIWISPGFSPHAIAVHPRVDHKVATKIQKAAIEMGNNKRGYTLLKINGFKGFVATKNKNYDDIRSLNIKILDRYLKNKK